MNFNKNFNVGKVISRLITGVLSLYVGGTILNEFGSAMNGTHSGLYSGLSLIGWTVGDALINGTAGYYYSECDSGTIVTSGYPTTCITDVSGTGVLSVIGILVIAQIIMEFISF